MTFMWLSHNIFHLFQANVVVETANDMHAANFKDRIRELYPSARFAVIDLDDKHKVAVRWMLLSKIEVQIVEL